MSDDYNPALPAVSSVSLSEDQSDQDFGTNLPSAIASRPSRTSLEAHVQADVEWDSQTNLMLSEKATKSVPLVSPPDASLNGRKYIAYTIKLPAEQLAALQSIWLELKRLYGTNSPDKSGMIQQAVEDWLKRWEGPERQGLLNNLLEIKQDTRRRQFRK